MDARTSNRIQHALFGVSVPASWPKLGEEGKIIASYTEPPTYIVQMVLASLFGQRLPKGIEKCAWELPLTFEGSLWFLSDWKNQSWRISTSSGSVESAERLKRKLNGACRVVDGFLAKLAKERLKDEDFSLSNDFDESRHLYTYYRSRLEYGIENADSSKITGPVGPARSAAVHKYYRLLKEAEANQIVTSIFFFAHTEPVLDACFSLLEPGECTYKDFRSLSWEERFKYILGEQLVRTHAKTYEHLIEIRRYYRNIPVHSSPLFLFFVEDVGQIPATFEDLKNPRISYGHRYKPDDGRRILSSFDSTIRVLEESDRTKCGYLYAESGLPIFIAKEFRLKLRSYMSSTDRFRREVRRRVDRYYAMINGEIT